MEVPKTMKAVIIESYKTQPIVKEIPVPIPEKNELFIMHKVVDNLLIKVILFSRSILMQRFKLNLLQ